MWPQRSFGLPGPKMGPGRIGSLENSELGVLTALPQNETNDQNKPKQAKTPETKRINWPKALPKPPKYHFARKDTIYTLATRLLFRGKGNQICASLPAPKAYEGELQLLDSARLVGLRGLPSSRESQKQEPTVEAPGNGEGNRHWSTINPSWTTTKNLRVSGTHSSVQEGAHSDNHYEPHIRIQYILIISLHKYLICVCIHYGENSTNHQYTIT